MNLSQKNWKKGWWDDMHLFIDYKGIRHHLLFAMTTTLKLKFFLLQNWIVLITAPGHKQLDIIWCFPLIGFKSEVMLEFISKFYLTQILSTFFRVLALEGFFPMWHLDVCSSLSGDITWPMQKQTSNAILFPLEAGIMFLSVHCPALWPTILNQPCNKLKLKKHWNILNFLINEKVISALLFKFYWVAPISGTS